MTINLNDDIGAALKGLAKNLKTTPENILETIIDHALHMTRDQLTDAVETLRLAIGSLRTTNKLLEDAGDEYQKNRDLYIKMKSETMALRTMMGKPVAAPASMRS